MASTLFDIRNVNSITRQNGRDAKHVVLNLNADQSAIIARMFTVAVGFEDEVFEGLRIHDAGLPPEVMLGLDEEEDLQEFFQKRKLNNN